MASWFVLEAVVFLASVLTHSLRAISILSDSQQHKLVLHKPFPCDFNTRMLNCTSAPYHCYWQFILLLETSERWQITVHFNGSAFNRAPNEKSKMLRFQICFTRTKYLSEIYKNRTIKVGAAKLLSVNSSWTWKG